MSEFMIKLGCFATSLILMGIPFCTGFLAREIREDTDFLTGIGLIMSVFELLALMLIMWKMLGVE